MPIRSSELAPRTTRSSPRSSIRFSQSRRSRKVRVGCSATAMPISRPRPCRARGPIGKWLYHWTTSEGGALFQEAAVERALHERIVDDLRRVDRLHFVVELRDDLLNACQLSGRGYRRVLEDGPDVPLVCGLHALFGVGLQIFLEARDRSRPIGPSL